MIGLLKRSNNKLLEPSLYWSVVLVLTLLNGYLLLIEHTFPVGVNTAFATAAQSYVLAVILLSLVAYVFCSGLRGKWQLHSSKSQQYPGLEDLPLLLLPLAPIVQYIILNNDILSVAGMLSILIQALLIALLLVMVIPRLLSPVCSTAMTMSLGLALCFVLFYMASLSLELSWHKFGDLNVQLGILAGVFLLCLLAFRFNRLFLVRLILVFFVVNGISSYFAFVDKQQQLSDKNEVLKTLDPRPFVHKPDIYLLTYDSYVANETMLGYGIDNSAQEHFLAELGFKLYPGTYSIGGATIDTMARVLDASVQFRHREAISGDSYVHSTLKEQGYTVAGIHKNTAFWRSGRPRLDYFYPENKDESHAIIFNSVLEGEFRFDAFKSFGKAVYSEFIAAKAAFIAASHPAKFMYMHTGPSHSQNSGQCTSDETQRFEQRLIKSNQEMKNDIAQIQATSPNALIIINGDHGPYLTGNCTTLSKNNFMPMSQVSRLDMQDRYGTFLAVKWPQNMTVYDQKINIIQDLFPAVLATLREDPKVLDKFDIETRTLNNAYSSGVTVVDGIIRGGVNDGEVLFLNSGRGN